MVVLTQSQYNKFQERTSGSPPDHKDAQDLDVETFGTKTRALILDHSVVFPVLGDHVLVRKLESYEENRGLAVYGHGNDEYGHPKMSLVKEIIKNFHLYKKALKEIVKIKDWRRRLANKRRLAAIKARVNRPNNAKKLVKQLLALA